MLLLSVLAVGYTFLPYGDVPRVRSEHAADAAIFTDNVDDVAQRVTRVVGETSVGSSTLLLVKADEAALQSLSENGEAVQHLDAGPFPTVEDAASLCKRWLEDYWECHKVSEDSNSCATFGACHRRCWWRGSIGRTVLQFETFPSPDDPDACEGTALAALLRRAVADAAWEESQQQQQQPDPKLLALRGAVVSFSHDMHYAGLRPAAAAASSRRVFPVMSSGAALARNGVPTLTILYGGDAGSEEHAHALAFRLRKTFDAKLLITVQQDSDMRDAFEVDVDGELLHSRLTRSAFGDARCESEEEAAYLIAKICAVLGLKGSEPIT